MPLTPLIAWAIAALLPIVIAHASSKYGEPDPLVQLGTMLVVFWIFLWLCLRAARLYDSLHS